MPSSSEARDRMVETQIARRGIRDPRLLEAMRSVPREAFVMPDYADRAYQDSPLPIGEGQTISQPYIVAFMIGAAELGPGDRALEIGAGSGYAAAVMSRIAARVHAIERHPALGEAARERLRALGYDNVEIRIGDGTRGWPEAAPFDAILVAAAGPSVPQALKEQLGPGGRLVMPVGGHRSGQTLLRVRRADDGSFAEETLASVSFVPLIGEQGWTAEGLPAAPAPGLRRSAPELIAASAERLPTIEADGFAAHFDRFADARVVLLGEASHGTEEFYRARAAITRRLVEEQGFTIVAVEADWPDAAAIDRHVRGRPGADETAPPFERFPTWMWRNTAVADLVSWMRRHNADLPEERRAGFHGLDIYNLRASIGAVLGYLDKIDPEAAALARERYGCLTPWRDEPSVYGRAVLTEGFGTCEAAVVRQCRDIFERQIRYAARDGEAFLDAAQNARLVASAERYYRIMYRGGAESWNLRDSHMFETLELLLKARGPGAKAVVWAHNSHIGDARFTAMGTRQGEHSLGQLCRQRWGDEAVLIGFGTNAGTVAAASDWGGEMEVMRVNPSRPGSYERLCHEAGLPRFLLDLRPGRDEAVRSALAEPRLERFIGVIYRPDTELRSHYMEASLPRQFDAFVWFDETEAVTPLGPQHAAEGAPETWPFGL